MRANVSKEFERIRIEEVAAYFKALSHFMDMLEKSRKPFGLQNRWGTS
jgi:hypothetical protein